MHVAESTNGILVDMNRAMLLDNVSNKNWWGHTELYATTIRNRYTTGTFQNRDTLYERWFHREADVKVLKPLGCTNLIYIKI